jgi:hypothetical protein
MIKRIATIFILMTAPFLFNGCKEKGCTDRNAINFNSVADEDDGSCIICQGSTNIINPVFEDLFDNNSSGGPHPFQKVASVTVTQVKVQYTYTQCGTNNCYFFVDIQSIVPETMTFNFNLQVSGNVSFNRFKVVTVGPYETVRADSIPSSVVSNPCGILPTTFFVNTSGSITYH